MDHDKAFMDTNLKIFETLPSLTREVPYFPSSLTMKKEEMRMMRTTHFVKKYENIMDDGKTWSYNDLPARFMFFLRRKTQSLCKGKVSRFFFPILFFFNFSKYTFSIRENHFWTKIPNVFC